jgi:hypothetical protein
MIARTLFLVFVAALMLAASAAADGDPASDGLYLENLSFASAPIPTPIGVGPRFHPAATPSAIAAAQAIGRLRCGSIARLQRAHIELFARSRVVIIPPGVGIARARACSYPARTVAPTGVVEFDAAKRLTVGAFFRIWGQRLEPNRLLSFAGRVRAYVGGERWRGPLRSIPLQRHAEIVLEVGPYVPPHAKFLFGPGR